MLVTYLRSSSCGTFDLCQFRHYLSYTLGLPDPSGIAAAKGTVTHKALELLARKKLCEQNGTEGFQDDELGIYLAGEDIDPEVATNLAYSHYSTKETHLEWSEADLKDCRQWVQKALDYDDGAYSPLKRQIRAAEQFFDIEIDEPWANYEYKINGQVISGKLRIKGTMDLIIELPGVDGVEMTDYKTSARRWIWSKNRAKLLKDFYDDIQLLLYHYALRKLYPEADVIFMTVFFIRAGGPVSIPMDKSDIVNSVEAIKSYFESIKNNQNPALVAPSFKCRFCNHSKTTWPGTQKSTCEFMEQQVRRFGLQKTTEKYIKLEALNSYTGGGQTR